jgi:hypothetical protein
LITWVDVHRGHSGISHLLHTDAVSIPLPLEHYLNRL